VRHDLIFQADQEAKGELESFGAMECHQIDVACLVRFFTVTK
jgi:hypothetical protein